MQPPYWSLPFEIMCDENDHVVGVILGEQRDKRCMRSIMQVEL